MQADEKRAKDVLWPPEHVLCGGWLEDEQEKNAWASASR